jgi:iduronate 2-sulfatase
MTGRRPDTTQVFNFVDHFRSTHGKNWSSLPQYFKQHGYLTLGTGKLYHPEVPPAKDVPFSWSSDEHPYVSPDGCTGRHEGQLPCVVSAANIYF